MASSTEPAFKVYLTCCEMVLLNEISHKECKRRDIAQTYRMSIAAAAENDEVIDWKKVNAAIIARWSQSGLEWIKNQAWSGKCFEPKKPKE
jgi:hypothetical protein